MRKILLVFFISFLAGCSSLVESDYQNLETVHVVFKTHFDIGFTDMADKVVEKYSTDFTSKVIKILESKVYSDQDFVWTVPGWPMNEILKRNRANNPETLKRLEQYLYDGSIRLHALPFTIQSEAITPEGLINSLKYSRDLCKKYNMPLPTAAKMTDVPSHSWMLPSILSKAGINFLHLGCNPASQSPEVPLFFFWEGPDGSRLLTSYVAENYGTGVLPPKSWKYKNWLAMIMTGDNAGPPSSSEVRSILRRANLSLPRGVKIKISSLDEFADSFLAENPDLQIVRGDMPDSWIHGMQTAPMATAAYFKAMKQTESAKKILSFSSVEHDSLIINHVEKVYDDIIRFSEHTWGINTAYMKRIYGQQWITAKKRGDFKRHEDSWDEKNFFAYRAEELSAELLEIAGQHLQKFSSSDLIVWNGSLVQTSSWVRLPFENMEKIPSYIVDIATNQQSQVVNDNSNFLAYVKNIAPCSFKSYNYVFDNHDVGSLVTLDQKFIENEYYLLEAATDGSGLAKFYDKEDLVDFGKVVDEEGVRFGGLFHRVHGADDVNRYLRQYLKIHPDWAYNDMGKRDYPEVDSRNSKRENITVEYLAFSGGHKAVVSYNLSPSNDFVTIEYILRQGIKELEVKIYWDDKTPTSYPESAWLSFPVSQDFSNYRIGRPMSVINPMVDIVSNSGLDHFAIQQGVGIFNDENIFLTVVPEDSVLVSCGRIGTYRFSKKFYTEKKGLYINLFNTQWGTNYPQWVDGRLEFSSKLSSGKIKSNDTSWLTRYAISKNNPLLAFNNSRKSEISNPLLDNLIEVRSGNIDYTVSLASDFTLVRVWERSGVSSSFSLKESEDYQLFVTDLFGSESRILEKKNIELSAWSFITLKIERK
ncbi:MAG: hypothetical protein JXR63_00255 [Spirochaetales bacterium]|nr:hypothetical protein [Spirochaetales bacterium]